MKWDMMSIGTGKITLMVKVMMANMVVMVLMLMVVKVTVLLFSAEMLFKV